ncbi:putative membrane protein (plasmid) [Streptomyces davaonensis JCM 4913]|uniref:Putative membrane protein n=1 Tax=Streptomyces davaonensis (strain DSM 101723 / JCM 4913 / KCC S-0913 / 768) TaxID=1214101 RepID=K4RGB6_STRDJ|nr:hypothetical protein [Streptomyces davaonensis]CCK32973.1 putative membrane protein [Streptomyces davaonensis JCM 4913]
MSSTPVNDDGQLPQRWAIILTAALGAGACAGAISAAGAWAYFHDPLVALPTGALGGFSAFWKVMKTMHSVVCR